MLENAEGYAKLGLWQDAWEAIEELPDDVRAGIDAMRLRLRCCAPLGAWDLGAELAYLLAEGNPPDRKAAAAFWLALCRECIEDTHTAQACVAAAVAAWPDCRLAILDDLVLSEILKQDLDPENASE